MFGLVQIIEGSNERPVVLSNDGKPVVFATGELAAQGARARLRGGVMTMRRTPQQIADDLETDIRYTIQKIYNPVELQVRDSVAFIVLGLFIGTVALIAQILGSR